MDYITLAQFSLQYGLILTIGIICGVLFIAFFTTFVWARCLRDAYTRDFKDRTLWIWLLLIPAGGIFFYGSGFILMFLISVVYIFLYRPRIF